MIESAVLTMCPDRHRFVPPHAEVEEWVDLSRRVSLRRILRALVIQHIDHPGETLSFDQLVSVGWPGERIILRAARNRLHVALSTLRRFGVQIEFHESGWRLPPHIKVTWAEEATEAAA
ncbi:MAG: hypothetical protein ACE366_13400 [Bradymonadia bacterium]